MPRDELSAAAQNEISSLITLFKINTGREEVEQIIAEPTTMTADFSWTTFYPELADRILDYANDREALLQKVWSVAEASGFPHLFKYLKGDHRLDGSYGPLRDVDPFTVLASFNRGIKQDARAAIAEAFASKFGVTAPVPITALAADSRAPGKASSSTPRTTRSQPSTETITAGGSFQYGCTATTTRPSSRVMAPPNHAHTGLASKSDNNRCMSGALSAAVRGTTTK